MTAAPRLAIYFTPPPVHPLWVAGCDWLGRDPRHGPPFPEPLRTGVREPWRYGFHATLKAPMLLAEGVSPDDFLHAATLLAARHDCFEMPALRVAMLTGFIALRPSDAVPASHPLRRLADDAVSSLDVLRAPMPPSEHARRLAPHFSARQQRNVERFGYPHVFDDWRFHMTLTDAVSDQPADRSMEAAKRHFAAALALPVPCDAISVFVEAARGEPFVLAHRVPLRPAP